MSTWANRAKVHFSNEPYGSTDKASETGVSSVSSVPNSPLRSPSKEVSSVLSVHPPRVFRNEGRADDLMEVAMLICDKHEDSEAAQAAMRADIENTPPELRADLLAHFREVLSTTAWGWK